MMPTPQTNSIFQTTMKPLQANSQQLVQNQHIRPASTMQQFLLASQFTVPQQVSMIKPQETAPMNTSIVNPISLAEMASIISPITKRRAESFVIEEIKVMLQEIDRRKHILLSVSPATNRLKRRAWEEVANCMALRWPQETRRSGDQIKKKWENLVSKTKRKVRDGHMTPDLDWNETNTLVMQFLASATTAIRGKHTASLPSNTLDYCPSLPQTMTSSVSLQLVESTPTSSTNHCVGSNNNNYSNASYTSLAVFPSQVSSLPEATSETPYSTPIPISQGFNSNGCKVENNPIRISIDETPAEDGAGESEPCSRDDQTTVPPPSSSSLLNSIPAWANLGLAVDESVLNSLAPLGNSLLNLPSTFGFPAPSNLAMQTEMMTHARVEHKLRVDVLKLQKRALKLQLEILACKRARFARLTDGIRNPECGVIQPNGREDQEVWDKETSSPEEEQVDEDENF